MKPLKIIRGSIKMLAAILISLSMNAQITETHFSLKNTRKDLSVSSSYYSTLFYEKDIGNIYQKLDSIFSILDTNMVMRISVIAFDADSLGSYLNFNPGLNLNFNGIRDSVFALHKPASINNRVKELIETGQTEQDRHIVIEQNTKLLKTVETNPRDKPVQEIVISDADILIKGGISSKIITAPALTTTDAKVHFKVTSKNGEQLKIVDISLTFEESRNLQIKILDKNGRVLFEENKKKYRGIYHASMEMKDELSPYYFVVVSDKRMFGRMLRH